MARSTTTSCAAPTSAASGSCSTVTARRGLRRVVARGRRVVEVDRRIGDDRGRPRPSRARPPGRRAPAARAVASPCAATPPPSRRPAAAGCGPVATTIRSSVASAGSGLSAGFLAARGSARPSRRGRSRRRPTSSRQAARSRPSSPPARQTAPRTPCRCRPPWPTATPRTRRRGRCPGRRGPRAAAAPAADDLKRVSRRSGNSRIGVPVVEPRDARRAGR